METDSENNLYVPVTIIGPIQIFQAGGDLVDQIQPCTTDDIFCTTTGIALDGEGNMFVSDALHHSIKKIDPDGTLITTIVLEGKGGFGAQPSPYGLAIDSRGSIYVADAANDCIKKYSPVSTTTTTVPGCPVVILYGDQASETNNLRVFRDEILGTTPEGRQLVDLYYRLSPFLAQALKDDEELKNDLRVLLDSLIGSSGVR
jgi:sugar lactone lactonase YvrE